MYANPKYNQAVKANWPSRCRGWIIQVSPSPARHPAHYTDETSPSCLASPSRIRGLQFLEASLNHIHKQISLIIYCFPNSNEMILVKKKQKTPPKNDSLKAKWKLAPGASRLLCCCVSPESRAGFWCICCLPSLLSSLGLAPLTKEGASFHVRQAGLNTLEGPLWHSHGLVSRRN